MSLRVWSLAVLVTVTLPLHGKQPRSEARAVTAEQSPRRVDQSGDPLPDGAIARRGVLRFQHGNAFSSLAFSPNGKMLASGGEGRDPSVRLWDLATGKELYRFERRGSLPELVVFSHSGHLFAFASANRDGIYLWDLRQNIELRSFSGHRSRIFSVVFSPSDEKLVSAGWDGTIRVWEVASGKELLCLPNGGSSRVLAVSQDGKLLASGGGDKLVRLWA